MGDLSPNKYHSARQIHFINSGSLMLGASYHAHVCSNVRFSDKFDLNEIFDAKNEGCNVIIHS